MKKFYALSLALFCAAGTFAGCNEEPTRGVSEGNHTEVGSCADACGDQSADGCWCDTECVDYGDCCQDKALVCDNCSDGEIVFTEPVQEYAQRARAMKDAFLGNGFSLVYDNDLGEPLADGFYFTVSYPGLDCAGLLEELMYYGIWAIGLNSTGSTQEGIRACVSLTTMDRVPELRSRLEAFHRDHA